MNLFKNRCGSSFTELQRIKLLSVLLMIAIIFVSGNCQDDGGSPPPDDQCATPDAIINVEVDRKSSVKGPSESVIRKEWGKKTLMGAPDGLYPECQGLFNGYADCIDVKQITGGVHTWPESCMYPKITINDIVYWMPEDLRKLRRKDIAFPHLYIMVGNYYGIAEAENTFDFPYFEDVGEEVYFGIQIYGYGLRDTFYPPVAAVFIETLNKWFRDIDKWAKEKQAWGEAFWLWEDD